MKKENARVNFNNLDHNQKVNFIKNLLFSHGLIDALDIILKDEKKNLYNINIIIDILDEELVLNRIKKECNLTSDLGTKNYVYSKIISVLSFYNKTGVLNQFFKSLDSNTLKQIAYYEYQNKTEVSVSSDVFKKYCLKYKEAAALDLVMSNEEVLMLTTEIKRYNKISSNSKQNKKGKLKYIFIVITLIIAVLFGYKLYETNKLISKYEGLIYPGIYLDDINLSRVNVNKLEEILLTQKQTIEDGVITITNSNDDYKFTYSQLGIKVEYLNTLNEIKRYNDNLSWIQKLKMVNSKKRYKTFYLHSYFEENDIDKFMTLLESKLNTQPLSDGLVIDSDYNVSYDKGKKGFKLDISKTKEEVKRALSNLTEETVIEAYGDVIENEIKNESLSVIDKKVSTYTTYFNNVGNRGHNIVLASSKLNKTLLMPGEVFSYLKTVGPYGASNGYRPAPIYLNGVAATANGGGVCQLASTLYNAQLRTGLETVYRTNHTYAPNYVPKGLDATVYSTTTDFKFKNQYNYPIYIISYVKGNYLTVDIWSSKDLLGNKTYEPYSIYSNGAYLSYLKEYDNGTLINEKYLGKSFYRSK